MTNTATPKNSLKCQDLVTLIKSCAESGVTNFSYDGLNISFKAIPTTEEAEDVVIERKSVTKTKKELEMEQLDELLISDPLEYETRLAELEQEQ